MSKSKLPPEELEKLIPDIVERVSSRVIDVLKNQPAPQGGYDCTGVEFSCLNVYECTGTDECSNVFDCHNKHTAND